MNRRMHEYHVIERWPEEGLCALRCSSSRYHVARALHVMPPEEAHLHGDRPRLGFGILLCTTSGAIFRLIFESIDETESTPVTRRMPSQPPFTQRNGPSAVGRTR